MRGQPPSWRMRIALVIYAVIWTVGLPFILLYLRRRGRKDALYAQHLGERFGRYSCQLKAPVWVHAVSLGELRSAVPLIRELLARGERVVCTHFTPAGRREAEAVFAGEIAAGRLSAVWVPLEFGWTYARFFRHFRPKLGLVMEIEIWPRMIFAAQKAGVPLLMCNAQYPSRSMVRDAKWVGLGLRHAMMQGFAGALVKSELQARRFASVGVQNIEVTGELRFDQPVPEDLVQAGGALREGLARGRSVVTLASVVEGEDDIYINAIEACLGMPDAPLFVYVPRAPERFDAVAARLERGGLRMIRRSDWLDSAFRPKGPAPEADVLLGDSLGEMYGYIAMADRVFTGGGFLESGAHNIIEPLALRRPVIVGPHIHTIEYPVTEAIAAGVCLHVAAAADLPHAMGWNGPGDAAITGFFTRHSGATARTMQAIEPFLAPTSR